MVAAVVERPLAFCEEWHVGLCVQLGACPDLSRAAGRGQPPCPTSPSPPWHPLLVHLLAGDGRPLPVAWDRVRPGVVCRALGATGEGKCPPVSSAWYSATWVASGSCAQHAGSAWGVCTLGCVPSAGAALGGLPGSGLSLSLLSRRRPGE